MPSRGRGAACPLQGTSTEGSTRRQGRLRSEGQEGGVPADRSTSGRNQAEQPLSLSVMGESMLPQMIAVSRSGCVSLGARWAYIMLRDAASDPGCCTQGGGLTTQRPAASESGRSSLHASRPSCGCDRHRLQRNPSERMNSPLPGGPCRGAGGITYDGSGHEPSRGP